jgi:ABC-type dipeptide/oligopeptide/nickel transport system permease subunit
MWTSYNQLLLIAVSIPAVALLIGVIGGTISAWLNGDI